MTFGFEAATSTEGIGASDPETHLEPDDEDQETFVMDEETPQREEAAQQTLMSANDQQSDRPGELDSIQPLSAFDSSNTSSNSAGTESIDQQQINRQDAKIIVLIAVVPYILIGLCVHFICNKFLCKKQMPDGDDDET